MVRHVISMDHRDEAVFPTRGTWVQVSTEVAGLGGGVANVKTELHAQANHRLHDDVVRCCVETYIRQIFTEAQSRKDTAYLFTHYKNATLSRLKKRLNRRVMKHKAVIVEELYLYKC